MDSGAIATLASDEADVDLPPEVPNLSAETGQ